MAVPGKLLPNSLAEFQPPKRLEKNSISKFPGACTSEIFLFRLRSVRLKGVRGAGCNSFEKIEDFREG
jgi:hypothetical protein